MACSVCCGEGQAGQQVEEALHSQVLLVAVHPSCPAASGASSPALSQLAMSLQSAKKSEAPCCFHHVIALILPGWSLDSNSTATVQARRTLGCEQAVDSEVVVFSMQKQYENAHQSWSGVEPFDTRYPMKFR